MYVGKEWMIAVGKGYFLQGNRVFFNLIHDIFDKKKTNKFSLFKQIQLTRN